ncbi:hypothetical protein L861_16445 [Litchfieldella anticariensis FP35 = DSM 16096]|uniref:Uncharacterized protein n=1 Tax=Litchfieldella anticariensis (strain DSM 16096 / CECT 5854 / CIP 108499 / LMG 22089 / FP35) TaxID=1121939 RepID=S2KHJ3_LITA3|nr:hypothetical protein [Halomonas anticariensis]EPC01607.1 hypothetical protein L861_16445 [Halomonas anticariensis FP35 = DSM 16096]
MINSKWRFLSRGPCAYHGIANCSAIDLNIPEAFPLEKMVELIRDFAQGTLERVLRLDVRFPPGLYCATALLRCHCAVTDQVQESGRMLPAALSHTYTFRNSPACA